MKLICLPLLFLCAAAPITLYDTTKDPLDPAAGQPVVACGGFSSACDATLAATPKAESLPFDYGMSVSAGVGGATHVGGFSTVGVSGWIAPKDIPGLTLYFNYQQLQPLNRK